MMADSSWTLSRIWAALKKMWLVIGLTTVLGAGIAFGISLSTTPTYVSRATLYFSIGQGNSGSDLNQGTTYAQNQMLSFAQLATSSRVLDPVIQRLRLSVTSAVLARDIDIVTPNDTLILEIRATAFSPDGAASVANEVAGSLSSVVDDLSPTTSTGVPSISASLVDTAVPPEFQTAPNKPRDTILGALVGVVVGVLISIVWSLFDSRIPTETVLRNVVNAPTLGTVTRVPGAGGNVGLVVSRDPLGRTSEEFRRIRSALSYAAVDRRMRRVLVTSSSPGEGKSTFAANLALTLAGLKSSVLLIDADLRRPRIADAFGVEGAIGLTTVLVGEVSLDDAKLPRPGTTLDVLPAGAIPPNPAELLTSDAMHALLEEASAGYDYVVLDTPPISSVADANLMSPLVDGAIVVVDATKTHRSQLAAALESFRAAGGRMIGVVLNKARRPRRADAYYAESSRRGATP
ncbi:MAG TPA: polysaccharide biosynthesis tyrosine autokinase [Propioniciclava sp.]|jgi:capsular exopolysaccharide synthesis family protein|uniref:polysaccharide biosynthesis tyrosine autokinase n=1 Tax=Propioniciclava sp. TaxID=2038686 RepID=UPI002B562668|nr:polysaccharide biosynthesis tyrosine autokinase [Propioniciclava sp.]HRL48590.1 polysaccharide biosynthesis tyrosine autokinase [Propioniciclava sp.]HRL80598.1 polysaccharide biosynthesis tyrosine autokinase [Propioniciclava sp.]